jgi:hypothetical protein
MACCTQCWEIEDNISTKAQLSQLSRQFLFVFAAMNIEQQELAGLLKQTQTNGSEQALNQY